MGLVEAFEKLVPAGTAAPESTKQSPAQSPTPIGRTSDTETLVAPTIQISEPARGYRWALPFVAFVLLLALIWLMRTPKPATQAAALPPVPAILLKAAETAAPTSAVISPQPQPAVPTKNIGTVASTSRAAPAPTEPPTKTPVAAPRAKASAEQPAKMEHVVDPVFGIAVPAAPKKTSE
jgi:hypothetical protein